MSTENNNTPIPAKKTIMQVKKEQVKDVISDIISNSTHYKSDYNPANALNGAWLHLSMTLDKDGKNAIETCSSKSMMESILVMLDAELNVLRKQCYLIPYAGKLECQISTFGKEVIVRRAGVINVVANAIYEKDEFAFEIDNSTGIKNIMSHKQTLESIGDGTKIKGAYVKLFWKDGRIETTIMSKEQILKSWNQRKGNGLTPAHQNFTDEMAIKTVKNRAFKPIVNSMTDKSSDMVSGDDDNIEDAPPSNSEIKGKANSEAIDFDEHEEMPTAAIAEPKKPEEAEEERESATAEPSFA
jgi:recombination protein RecT